MDQQLYTPMMQQYLKIKEDYADAIVFFRLGDFYEMFFDDAIVASKVLEIALTSRDAGAKVPMCGVPYHSVKPYIQKLIEKGFKIAIAEQVTEPGKGLVEREVVRLITPGTVFEEGILDQNTNNYIASIVLTEKGYALTHIDVSTGEAYLTDHLNKREALDLILSLEIKEVVAASHFDTSFLQELEQKSILISHFDHYQLHEHRSIKHLTQEQRRAASHLLSYLSQTQKDTLNHLMTMEYTTPIGQMHVDFRVKNHLEIMTSLTHQPQTTLIHLLNHCQTAMGSRLLKAFLHQPLKDCEALNDRYDYIEGFSYYAPRNTLLEHLKYIYDIHRIVGRVSFQTVNARDLYQLRETLKQVPFIKDALKGYEHPKIQTLSEKMETFTELTTLLDKAIIDNPPLTIKEGGIIQTGYSEKLDALRDIDAQGASWLEAFEQEERNKTGIKNLKIGYNRVFGYFIEISKGQTQFVRDEFGYERKQTLTNSERYISPELKEKEDQILHAKDQAMRLEYELFVEIRQQVAGYIHDLQELALQIAHVDVYLNLAVIAEKNQYIRPQLHDERHVRLLEARHPVVEKFTTFIKNDVMMKEGEIFLITGPNMSGKSTYMRMFAIIVYMAQIGSFVPADEAVLPIYDALYTRIGSSDDLSGGKSTFMVEMVESNEALTYATPQSLVLFDEIGRGTATYDGMALAQGMIEYIHEKIGCQTLFSTHYHELTALEQSLSRLTNLSVKAKEENNKMIFLHKVEKGTTDKSYGIQVASLAHLPKSLIARSQQILAKLENKETKMTLDLFNYEDFEKENTAYIDVRDSEVLAEIEKVNIDQMTPIDALLLLRHLQSILKKK
ncbi:MAG: DNA mismatch repair protein MutS [Acholeplasmataceae bacterium]|nr:DNA mismatch repair protein MutS [Acholeplasmataceae bacterium]